MKVIALTGLPRSGKDTVADLLVKEFGFKKFVLSDILGEKLIELGRQKTKAEMNKLGNELRQKYGQAIVGELLAEKVKTANHEKVLVVGVRSLEELIPFRKLDEKLVIVSVSAPKEKRFTRRSKIDPQIKEEFFKREESDIKEKGLDKVIQAAEVKIENNSDLNSLYNKIRLLMRKI